MVRLRCRLVHDVIVMTIRIEVQPDRIGSMDPTCFDSSAVRYSNIGRGEILTFPDTLTTQGLSFKLSLWCFNIVGGEILTFPDTLTTQGLPYPYGVST